MSTIPCQIANAAEFGQKSRDGNYVAAFSLNWFDHYCRAVFGSDGRSGRWSPRCNAQLEGPRFHRRGNQRKAKRIRIGYVSYVERLAGRSPFAGPPARL